MRPVPVSRHYYPDVPAEDRRTVVALVQTSVLGRTWLLLMPLIQDSMRIPFDGADQ